MKTLFGKLALLLLIVSGASRAETFVTSCDPVVGVGYNAFKTGTYLIPYPNGQTPWAFGCRSAYPMIALTPPSPVYGVRVHVCENPINIRYNYENFAVVAGASGSHWMQACTSLREVSVVHGHAPGCNRFFNGFRCLNPRGVSRDLQNPARLIPGFPTQNPGHHYGVLCERVQVVPVCAN